MWIMSLIGPQTTPREPAYAQPRMVITPGRDFLLEVVITSYSIHYTKLYDNDDGNNALWFACRNGDAEMLHLLIGQGIDIDNQNLNGTTPLIYAASAGLGEMVRMLLASGADVGLRTLDEFSSYNFV